MENHTLAKSLDNKPNGNFSTNLALQGQNMKRSHDQVFVQKTQRWLNFCQYFAKHITKYCKLEQSQKTNTDIQQSDVLHKIDRVSETDVKSFLYHYFSCYFNFV